MPVYHITLHAYRSWNADNPRGYIRKDRKGVQPPDQALARSRDRWAKYPALEFGIDDQKFLVNATRDAAAKRGWDLLGVTVTTTHVHSAIAVRGENDSGDIQARLKSGLGYQLAQQHGTKGRPYFSHGGVPERVKDEAHLRYLLEQYFPKHHSPIWCKAIVWKRGASRGASSR